MSGHVRHGIPTAFDADAARFCEIAGSAIIVAKSREHMREMLSVTPDGYGLATDCIGACGVTSLSCRE